MNKYKFLSALVAVMLIFGSCADENLSPIVTFDSAGKGAYPRLISEGNKLINLFDIGGSQYTYTIEFVDENRGADVAEYVLEMVYEDNNPSNGDKSVGPIEYLRMSSSEFTTNAGGYQEAPTITITANQAIAAAGTTADEVKAGDNFKFIGKVILEDGATFTQSNSSATVYGSAFQGHFDFTLPAACPSDLTGTFPYVSTNTWCGTDPAPGTVDIQAQGGGVYKFSDWAFGTYGSCYGGGTAGGDLTFTEVCAEVRFSGFTDSFGDTWTYNSSIDGDEWTIAWDNTYGEAGTVVITNPSGDWPFVLVD